MDFKKEISVTVTGEHIARALRSRKRGLLAATTCPLAEALRDMFPKCPTAVNSCGICIMDTDFEVRAAYEVPPHGKAFLAAFDDGKFDQGDDDFVDSFRLVQTWTRGRKGSSLRRRP